LIPSKFQPQSILFVFFLFTHIHSFIHSFIPFTGHSPTVSPKYLISLFLHSHSISIIRTLAAVNISDYLCLFHSHSQSISFITFHSFWIRCWNHLIIYSNTSFWIWRGLYWLFVFLPSSLLFSVFLSDGVSYRMSEFVFIFIISLSFLSFFQWMDW